MIARAVALLCLVAACSSPQRSTAGRTRETAIQLHLAPDAETDTLVAERDGPGIALPHWYRVTLAAPARVHATARDDDGSTLSVEALATDGTFASLDPLRAPAEPMIGDVFIRVDGHTPPYHLQVVASAVHPIVEMPIDAGLPPCDPRDVDPTNPSCAGVVPCDANKPDFKNASCCAGCIRCEGNVVRIPGTNYGWLDIGSRHGLTRSHRIKAFVSIGGKPIEVPAGVHDVERDRSKIFIGRDMNVPTDDPDGGAFVDLRDPLECSRYRFHYR